MSIMIMLFIYHLHYKQVDGK